MFSHTKKGVETLFPPHYTPEYIIQYSVKEKVCCETLLTSQKSCFL